MPKRPPPKAATMFVVSEFKNGIWREILATHIETDARALLKRLGTKGKVEELKQRPPKR